MKHLRRIRPSIAVLAAALSSMALYACGQNGQPAGTQTTAAAPPALPLTTGAETAPIYAPSVGALPAAPRPKIVRVASQADEYAYVDQASSMTSALGSAPPDYGFDYDGVRPWVWRTSDNAAQFVEPVEGGYRYYYYQPGASYPYLIRDPQYAYGFDNGQLVVVYDSRGDVLPPAYIDQRADDAGRYLARARALYNASLQNQRHSVIAANWAARRAEIDAQQAQWARQQSQDAAWREYHQQHDADQQGYWQAERQRREAAAAQFDQWHDGGYQGPPPPPSYAPVAGAALVGAAVGGLLAGRDHHDDHNQQPTPRAAPGPDHRFGPNNPQPDQAAAVAQAHQQQAQQDAARQAQAQQQAAAASAAREQAVAQGRRQQAGADAARQADAQHQAAALADARKQQTQADTRAQAQAAMQARQQAAAQAASARQQQQAASAQSAQDKAQRQAARTQAVHDRQQQATAAATARQAQDAATAHAAQAQAQAARQNQQAARAQAAQAQAAQAQAAQSQAQARQAQGAARAQAQAAQAHQQAAAAHAAAAGAAHPARGPRPEDGARPPAPQQ